MAVNTRSPWFFVYVFVSTVLAVTLVTWIFDDVNWGYSIFLGAAAAVGILIGTVIRSRRTH